ncbi:MAG: serine/threonine protein kinase [Myxococcales bacterium]|nr:serine/threonine protein kinase [Myxococcales bacterium]
MSGAPRADWIAGERPRLGKYQLIRRLATGGMAEIYLARAAAIEGFEKLVVLKRILPQYAESEAFIRMFLAEARLAATLHHPNIVQVYDIGEDDGAYFFAMEYVQGVDLRQLFAAARRAGRELPLQHVLHVITGLCAGLHYAHEMKDTSGAPLGIVHRDVSPSNVLVTFDGAVKVVDFGIAKAANVSTTAGTLKGKIPYMSPEQCHSRPLDRRSDVFSIGTLLWELTTGRRLFQADNELALLGVVARGEITRPRDVRPDYSPDLEAIVLRALALDPSERWQTAQDLQLALEDFAHEARLPLSAARFQPFLREVCADAIAKAEAMVAAPDPRELERDEADEGAAPEDETAVYGSAGSPAGTPGPAGPGGGATDPGGARSAEATAAPVTTVTIAPAIPPSPSPRRWGMVLGGAAAALVGLAGLAALAFTLWPRGSDTPTTDEAGATRRAEEPGTVEAAAPKPDEEVSPPEPETETPETETPEPETPEPETPEPETPEAETPKAETPEAESPEPKAPDEARTSKTKSRGGRRSTSRPASGKSTEPAPSKEPKPAWNPKAPPPPGL